MLYVLGNAEKQTVFKLKEYCGQSVERFDDDYYYLDLTKMVKVEGLTTEAKPTSEGPLLPTIFFFIAEIDDSGSDYLCEMYVLSGRIRVIQKMEERKSGVLKLKIEDYLKSNKWYRSGKLYEKLLKTAEKDFPESIKLHKKFIDLQKASRQDSKSQP
ncbi:hypothetical protein SAMN02745181_0695 [Rubritalea squalenifaciens DSM 18772]|uniref:Uncharacterized protein n=2 Tax=Rubritalea squalenifaciens TaxID=407226 RepID=A0A1M6DBQ3_9BACT|nr:hypothetical protein SAMN02745181_0695 [Rubritalea squalenifaciens DSM 18772]